MDEKLYSFEKSYAEKVYEQMNGFYMNEEVPGVRDESKDGFVKQYIDALYDARDRLCQRFSIPLEDEDIDAILNTAEDLSRACGLAMFHYGSQWTGQD